MIERVLTMTVYELTGQESGIVVYDSGETLVVNWSQYDDNRLPKVFGALGAFGWPEDEDIFAGCEKRHVIDIRDEIPGTMTIDEDGNVDCDIDIVIDENHDLVEIFLAADEPTAGEVYTLTDGTKIIAPSDWN